MWQVEKEAVDLAQETTREDEQRVKVGALAPLDEKQAESQAATAQSDLLTAQTSLVVQENVLKSLLAFLSANGRAYAGAVGQLLAVPENPDVQECWRAAWKTARFAPGQSQRRKTARHHQVRLQPAVSRKLTSWKLWPQRHRLTFGQNLNAIRNGNYPFYSYGLALTVPLGNTGARNNYKVGQGQPAADCYCS